MVDWRLMLLSVNSKTLVLCCLLALGASADAKRLYQFTDENGIINVTDRPPDTDQPVTSRPVKVEPENAVAVYNSGPQNRFPERFENKLYGPIELEVKAVDAENIWSDPPLPHRFVLEPRFNGQLVQFRPRSKNRGYRLKISYRAVPGDPNARHDPAAVYLPPFPPGYGFRVSQGFNGNLTHTSPDSRYAVDIPMPEGTPIVAARDGVVMDVQDDFYEGGDDLNRFGQRANRIIIVHDDGTMGVYAHLAPESARIRPGSVVLAGEVIGHSGNTGYSTGPHLHFAVQRNAGMRIESIPFYFLNQAGKKTLPETGQRLIGRLSPVR